MYYVVIKIIEHISLSLDGQKQRKKNIKENDISVLLLLFFPVLNN